MASVQAASVQAASVLAASVLAASVLAASVLAASVLAASVAARAAAAARHGAAAAKPRRPLLLRDTIPVQNALFDTMANCRKSAQLPGICTRRSYRTDDTHVRVPPNAVVERRHQCYPVQQFFGEGYEKHCTTRSARLRLFHLCSRSLFTVIQKNIHKFIRPGRRR